jgi:DNA-binding beta-propeller fold protein YncE
LTTVAESSRRPASPLLAILLAAIVLLSAVRTDTQSVRSVAAIVCDFEFTSPTLMPVSGSLGGIVIDDRCEHAYITNTTANRVEDLSLKTMTLGQPISVGAGPKGLDLRPGTNLLYVANATGGSISVVDLSQHAEVRRITSPPSTNLPESPNSIAIANNGLALYATEIHGSNGGALFQLELSTEQVTRRTEYFVGDTTRLKASRERNVLGIVIGGNSGGQVIRYDAATATFRHRYLGRFLSQINLDRRGVQLITVPGAYALDAAMNLAGTVPHSNTTINVWGGSEIAPNGRIGYRSLGSKIDVMDLRTFLKTGELSIGDTTSSFNGIDALGMMDLSDDGRVLAVISDHGISMVRTRSDAFTDTLVAGTTPIRAVHITELRDRINGLRTLYGLAESAWTEPSLTGAFVKAVHVAELRAALQQAYDAASVTPPTFTDQLQQSATPIKALHVKELRNAVLALEAN